VGIDDNASHWLQDQGLPGDDRGTTADAPGQVSELSLLAGIIPGVIYRRRHDERCTLLEVNDEIQMLTGYSRSQFLAGAVTLPELFHPEDAPWIPAEIDQALAERQHFQLIYRLRHLSGDWRWVEEFGIGVWVGDELTALVGYIRDITERRRTAELILENQQRYQLLFDHSPAGIVQYDGRLRITECNERFATLVGSGRQQLLGSQLEALCSGEVLHLLRDGLNGAEGRWEGGLRPDVASDSLWISMRVAPFCDHSGAVRGGMAIVEDISESRRAEEERKRLEAQVQQAQKLESLGVLAGGIAHDFNNLLMGILGNADLALIKLTGDTPARDNLIGIVSAARHAAELAKQMLAYSGRGQFLIEEIDLSDLVSGMANLLDVTISKKADLRYDLTPGLPAIEADATQIRQVIMNLTTNASEAIGEHSGVLTISTGAAHCDSEYLAGTYLDDDLAPGNFVYLEVADTGTGMNESTQAKMFEPFFTTKFTGRGLGLAAVLGIVRGHKGALKVTSAPGQGTTIRVLFPAKESEADDHDLAGQTPVPRWGGHTVLVVDDDDSVRAVVCDMLKRLGFDVVTARDGAEGIDVFRANADHISLVLLDMAMPRMNGEEAFRAIRNLKRDARVILCSGYSEQETTARVAGEGLAGFLQKPYVLSTLRDAIEEVLAR